MDGLWSLAATSKLQLNGLASQWFSPWKRTKTFLELVVRVPGLCLCYFARQTFPVEEERKHPVLDWPGQPYLEIATWQTQAHLVLVVHFPGLLRLNMLDL